MGWQNGEWTIHIYLQENKQKVLSGGLKLIREWLAEQAGFFSGERQGVFLWVSEWGR